MQKEQVLLVCCLSIAGAAVPTSALDRAALRISTQNAPWAQELTVAVEDAKSVATLIDIDTTVQYQTIEGLGGCFNELGWKALQSLPVAQADTVIKALFDTVSGCKLNFCRMPIGASDYALSWYSLDETANDTLMTSISIERDKGCLIPFIKAAMRYNPRLKLWASPWSPPSWMKTNGTYAGANSAFKQQSTMLGAYALYFTKAINLYRAEGIDLCALAFQNEPWSASAYPGCLWTPAQIRDFIKLYLGPRFDAEKLDCDIWSPTMNNGDINSFKTLVDDPGCAKFLKNMCFQWEGKNAVQAFHAAYPSQKLFQTENECGNGTNDWAYAESPTYYYMKFYFDNGASGYMQWNMVLDNSGRSTWAWVQNAMISIDTARKTVRYNPQFYVVKHFGYYVKAGARKIRSSGTFINHVAFLNPDGSIVVVANNTAAGQVSLGIRFGAKMVNVQIPAKSFATIVISTAASSAAAPKAFSGKSDAPAVSLLRGAHRISIISRCQTLNVRILGCDGTVKAAASSLHGRTITMSTTAFTPGVYIVSCSIDGRGFQTTMSIE